MLHTSHLVAFVPATDLARARAFYETVLGLRLLEVTDYACVFDAHGTVLRVTAVGEVAHPGYTVLGWRVDDLAVTMGGLTSAGVVFARYEGLPQDSAGVWTTPSGDPHRVVHRPRRQRALTHAARVSDPWAH